MGLIYLDSCVLIYLVEPNLRWTSSVQSMIAGTQDSAFAISPLVKAECLVVPIRRGDKALHQTYLSAFPRYRVLPMDEDVFLDAAKIRAEIGVKLPDALHVACARRHGCTEFWTNDNRLPAMGDWVRVLAPE